MLGTKALGVSTPVEKAAATMDAATDLTAHNRCDRCGAQAYAVAGKSEVGTLMFCGHHFAEVENTLREQGWDVLDQRSRLTAS